MIEKMTQFYNVIGKEETNQDRIAFQNSFKVRDKVKIKTSNDFDVVNECLMRYQVMMDQKEQSSHREVEEAIVKYKQYIKNIGEIVDIFPHWYWPDSNVLVFKVYFKELNESSYFFWDEMEKL